MNTVGEKIEEDEENRLAEAKARADRIRLRQEKAMANAKDRMQKVTQWEEEEKRKKKRTEQIAHDKVMIEVEQFKTSPEYIQLLETKEARRQAEAYA